MYTVSCFFSIVQLPGASLASVEVLMNFGTKTDNVEVLVQNVEVLVQNVELLEPDEQRYRSS